MKKKLCLLFLFIEILAYSQDYTTLHNRYWYYRTRLRNDFMKVGLANGCSIPMEERGDGYSPNPNDPFNFTAANSGEQGKWGDAMGELGYYIGVLATEYHLLELNHQETDSVKWELYCALQALNRMDYYAEPYFTKAIANSTNPQTFGASINGFMLRDDVPLDFIQNNLKHFNYFGNKGFCSKVKVKNISTTSGSGAQMQGETYNPPKNNKPGYYEKNYAGSYISQDNWINCIVGLALVRKFVLPGINYKNLSFMDGNGPDINQEAFAIALRVMNYFKQDPTWSLKYPAGNLVGSHWGGIGAGLAFAHAEALNKMDKNKWGHFVQPDPISFDNWCEYNNWRNSGSWVDIWIKHQSTIPMMYLAYLSSPHASGSLGNLYTQLPSVLLTSGERVYKWGQLYPTPSSNDVSVQVANISAVGNCEYTFSGVDTKHQLQHHINKHEIWHAELIRVALHGEGNCSTTNLNNSYYNNAISLISNAPCYGPAKWDESGNINPNNEWDTQTRLDHPEARGGSGWPGEYNGIDYMLYHNLVTIIDIEKNGLSDNKQMVDFGQRHITRAYPTIISGQSWGTNSKPATVKSFEYIVGNNIIGVDNSLFDPPQPNTPGNVTYLAGKEITLGNGFSAVQSSSFTAAIQQFSCSEIMSNPLNSSVNARIANSTNDSILYPDLVATSYQQGTIAENNENKEDTRVNYKPTLAHVDSIMTQSKTNFNNAVNVKIAPNPSAGLTKVYITKPELIKSIDVIDPTNRLLFTLHTISYSNELDLENMSKGVYIIVIKGIENNSIIKKLIIQ